MEKRGSRTVVSVGMDCVEHVGDYWDPLPPKSLRLIYHWSRDDFTKQTTTGATCYRIKSAGSGV